MRLQQAGLVSGSRVPARGCSWAGLVRQVPPARRSPAPAAHRAGVELVADGRRPASSPGAPPRPRCAALLDDERERWVPGSRLADVTFAEAASEWLRYVEHDRACKATTLRGYRSSVNAHLVPEFGDMLVAEITAAHIERWRATLTDVGAHAQQAAHRAARHLPPGAEAPRAARQPGGTSSSRCARRAAWTSRCSRRRRSARWCAPPPTSRTPRSTSPPPSPACAAASCWRCAGATSTSPRAPCASARPSPPAR